MKPSLTDIPFLADAAPELLAAMDEETEWFSLPSGAALLNAGEPPEGVWFLISGSLAAFRPADQGRHHLLGYIRPGEPVGEMALIAATAKCSSLRRRRLSGWCRRTRP
jgi:NTE family protein